MPHFPLRLAERDYNMMWVQPNPVVPDLLEASRLSRSGKSGSLMRSGQS